MKNTISKGWLSLLIVMGILILDQIIKIAVKTNMYYNENIRITDWFYIHFVENPGMAFGMQVIPKAVQTIGRILFAGIIIWYIGRLIKANCKRGYLICISLILAVIFSQSTLSEVATFVPIGHGYTDWLYGKVVDMFYFPLFEFNWPGWMPFIGGDNFIFFSPIFNFADAAISCGVIILLLFYKKYSSDSIHMIKNDLKSKLAS